MEISLKIGTLHRHLECPKGGCCKAKAEEMKKKLEAAGAKATLK